MNGRPNACGLRTLVTPDAMKPGGRSMDPMSMLGTTSYEEQLRQKKMAMMRVGADPVGASIKTRMDACQPVTQDLSHAYKAFSSKMNGSNVLRIGDTTLLSRACGSNGLGVAPRLLNTPRFTTTLRHRGNIHATCEGNQVVGKNFTGFAYSQTDPLCKHAAKCNALHGQQAPHKSSAMLLNRGKLGYHR